MQEEIANVSANIPGTGVTPAGKPAGFGDPIVNPGAAKRWKAINKTHAGDILRRKKPNIMEAEKKKVKIKLDPEKEIGYTVHSVGPGRKLTLTKSGTMKAGDIKEEEKKKPFLNKKRLGDYIKKASDNRAKNQGEFDFYYKKKNSKKYGKAFRNVINRRKGIRAATDRLVKEETFAGAMVFEVSSKLFYNITLQKRKGKHWRTYLEEDDCYAEIREWARKHPKSKMAVRNENTGEIRYIKY